MIDTMAETLLGYLDIRCGCHSSRLANGRRAHQGLTLLLRLCQKFDDRWPHHGSPTCVATAAALPRRSRRLSRIAARVTSPGGGLTTGPLKDSDYHNSRDYASTSAAAATDWLPPPWQAGRRCDSASRTSP